MSAELEKCCFGGPDRCRWDFRLPAQPLAALWRFLRLAMTLRL
jgi:hypothetical protein